MGLINEDLQGEMCQKFDILWIIDNANIFFRDFGPLDTKFLDLLLNKKVNYDLRFSDLLSFALWYQLYQMWSKSIEMSRTFKKVKANKNSSKMNRKDGSPDTKVDIVWLWHSCLYGHKENLKRILEKFSNSIKINEIRVNGNTAIHLAIFGNHFPVSQILLGKDASRYGRKTHTDF